MLGFVMIESLKKLPTEFKLVAIMISLAAGSIVAGSSKSWWNKPEETPGQELVEALKRRKEQTQLDRIEIKIADIYTLLQNQHTSPKQERTEENTE